MSYDYALDDHIQYVPVPDQVSDDAIAMRVKGDSMTNPSIHGDSFKEGSIIIVEKRNYAEHKDYIIAMLPGSSEITFKQYVVDAGIPYLKPLNPIYPTISFPKESVICGVVVANMQFFK